MTAQTKPAIDTMVRIGAVRSKIAGLILFDLGLEQGTFEIEFFKDGPELPFQAFRVVINLLRHEPEIDYGALVNGVNAIVREVPGFITQVTVNING